MYIHIRWGNPVNKNKVVCQLNRFPGIRKQKEIGQITCHNRMNSFERAAPRKQGSSSVSFPKESWNHGWVVFGVGSTLSL